MHKNILIVFTVSGLWHGAGFNFIIWGLIHGSFQVLERKFKMTTSKLRTILVVFFAWIFFRSPDFSKAIEFIKQFSETPSFLIDYHMGLGPIKLVFLLSILLYSLIYLRYIEKRNNPIFWFTLIPMIFFFSELNNSFIYFQF